MNATQTIKETLNRLLDEKKETEKGLLSESRITSIEDTYDTTMSEQLEIESDVRLNESIKELRDGKTIRVEFGEDGNLHPVEVSK